MPFERGRSGNPAGGPVGSRHRQQLNGEFIAALLRDFRHGGPKAIERVRRTQPAAYLKILALLVPREMKVEHSNAIKDLTDEQLEAMIEYIETSLAAQAGAPAKMIEGTIEPISVEVQRGPLLDSPKPKNGVMPEAERQCRIGREQTCCAGVIRGHWAEHGEAFALYRKSVLCS